MSDSLLPHEYIIKRLRELQPQHSIIYFTGFLDEERNRSPFGPASVIATVAYDLMKRGLVHLTQKRVSPPRELNGLVNWNEGTGQGFTYIATGATPKKKPIRWT